MEQRLLRHFVAVAEEACFSRAAHRLGITQPALSRQIRKLEEQLGVQLFRRTKLRAQLTEAGEVFLAEIERGLAQIEHAGEEARRVGLGEVGHLAIGFVGPATYSILPPVLQTFRQQYPRVDLDVDELTTGRQLLALRENTIQLGLLYPEAGYDGLTIEPILAEPVVVALPRRHPLAGDARLHLADLDGEPLILYRRDQEPALVDLCLRLCADAGLTPLVRDGANAMHLSISLVAAGQGFTFLPASARNLRHPEVVFRSVHPPAPRIVLAAAWRSDNAMPILPLFLDVLRETAASHACRGTHAKRTNGHR